MPPARGRAAQPEHGKYAQTVCRWRVADKHRLVAPTPYRKPVLILFISMVSTEQMHSTSRGQHWVMNALTKHSWISKGPVGKTPVCISCPRMLLQRDIGTCGLGEHHSWKRTIFGCVWGSSSSAVQFKSGVMAEVSPIADKATSVVKGKLCATTEQEGCALWVLDQKARCCTPVGDTCFLLKACKFLRKKRNSK